MMVLAQVQPMAIVIFLIFVGMVLGLSFISLPKPAPPVAILPQGAKFTGP